MSFCNRQINHMSMYRYMYMSMYRYIYMSMYRYIYMSMYRYMYMYMYSYTTCTFSVLPRIFRVVVGFWIVHVFSTSLGTCIICVMVNSYRVVVIPDQCQPVWAEHCTPLMFRIFPHLKLEQLSGYVVFSYLHAI